MAIRTDPPHAASGQSICHSVRPWPDRSSATVMRSGMRSIASSTRTPDIVALKANRIHLLAARRWSDLGRELPPQLEADVRRSLLMAMLVPEVLARVGAAYDGLVVHKGPEIARRYPDPAFRPFIDLDVLARDTAAAQAPYWLQASWRSETRRATPRPLISSRSSGRGYPSTSKCTSIRIGRVAGRAADSGALRASRAVGPAGTG